MPNHAATREFAGTPTEQPVWTAADSAAQGFADRSVCSPRHPVARRLEAKARVWEILNRWPAVGLAVGVLRNGSLEFFFGHGVADIPSNTPITEDTVFRIASITKTFTAIAVMQLWQQGSVDLDAPANDYLRAYRLIPVKASFRPATVRHLLTGWRSRVSSSAAISRSSTGEYSPASTPRSSRPPTTESG
jgi:CubicO group peptidase (beta-lactamase class C family)